MNSENNTEVLRGNNGPFAQDLKRRARSFCFTDFREEEPIFDETRMKYMIYGKEICPSTGRHHWQGYVYFKNPLTFSALLKKLNIKTHGKAFICNGSPESNFNYCSKDKNYIEHGIKPRQGKRTDLEEVKNEILNTDVTVDQICTEDPELYHQYGRTLEKLEDIKYRSRYERDMPEVKWIYGPTGSGKSHQAFDGFHPDTHFVWTNDNGWWDGYHQQPVVIMNDFRGEIPYNNLLKLCDKWPEKVRRRNREPIYFTSNTIIITSSLHPAAIYKHRDEEDKLEQLYRRIKIINTEDTTGELHEECE